MATRLQLARNITSVLNENTPAEGEPWFDTQRKELVIGDGTKMGGYRTPRQVTPYEFGAVGDGVTDDTAAMQGWAAAVSDLGYGFVPKGRYIVKEPMLISSSCRVTCSADAVFDASQDTTEEWESPVITFDSGAHESLPSLFSEATKHGTTIEFLAGHGLVEGDVIGIQCTDDFSLSGYRDYYRKGELNKVAKVDGAQVTLEYPLSRSYNPVNDNIKCYKLGGITVNWNGGKLVGKTESQFESQAVFAFGLVGSSLDFDSVVDFSGRAIELSVSMDSKVRVGQSFDGREFERLAYAVVFSGVRNCWVADSTLAAQKHAFTFSGGSKIFQAGSETIPLPPSIASGVRDSTLASNVIGAADFHGNTLFCGFDGITAYGGVQLAGESPYLKNSTVYDVRDNPAGIEQAGTIFQTREMIGVDMTVSNVDFYITTDLTGTGIEGTRFYLTPSESLGGCINMHSLKFISSVDVFLLGTIALGRTDQGEYSSISVSDMEFVNLAPGNNRSPRFRIQDGTGKAVDFTSVENLTNISVDINGISCPSINVDLVTSYNTELKPVSVIFDADEATMVSVSNCTAINGASAGVAVSNIGSANEKTIGKVTNCTSLDNDSYSIIMLEMDTVVLSGNTVGNRTTTNTGNSILLRNNAGRMNAYEVNNVQPYSDLTKEVFGDVVLSNSIPAL